MSKLPAYLLLCDIIRKNVVIENLGSPRVRVRSIRNSIFLITFLISWWKPFQGT